MARQGFGGVGARPFRGISGGAQSGGRRTPVSVRANGNQRAALASCLTVSAPARIDLARVVRHSAVLPGLGGTVFNMAITVNGTYPIRTIVPPAE